MNRNELEIFLKITKDGAFANLALKEGLSSVRTNAVGRSTALIYTALENLNYCDFIIDSYAKGRVHTSIRGIMRLALTELFFMDTPDHAVCSTAQELTARIGKQKLKGFVNGVLRSVIRDRDAGWLPGLPDDFVNRMEILSGYPDFLISEYASAYGEKFTEELLLCRVKGTCVRAVYPNPAETLEKHFNETGISFKRGALVEDAFILERIGGSITEDELFRSGALTVQSESAMLACRCLSPEPGMNVLDACAAPGGKTAYLFDIMERRGKLTAWDVHPHRVKLIESTLERLGISGVECRAADASVPDNGLEGSFDAILCDVPCSGLGGGSKPDARYRRTQESISELSELQYGILSACSTYLKRDGALVYSTCTLTEAENERVIERFLNEHTGFSLRSLEPYIPEKLKKRGEGGMLRIFPNTDNAEGFFIARLGRDE